MLVLRLAVLGQRGEEPRLLVIQSGRGLELAGRRTLLELLPLRSLPLGRTLLELLPGLALRRTLLELALRGLLRRTLLVLLLLIRGRLLPEALAEALALERRLPLGRTLLVLLLRLALGSELPLLAGELLALALRRTLLVPGRSAGLGELAALGHGHLRSGLRGSGVLRGLLVPVAVLGTSRAAVGHGENVLR